MLTTLLKITQTQPTQDTLDSPISFQNFVKTLKTKYTDQYTDVSSSSVISNAQTSDANFASILEETNLVTESYCSAPSFVESQIPFWIKQEYADTGAGENYLIAFLTEYYNWLYCGFKKEEIKLTPYDVEELLDIDRVPDIFIEQYVKTYAPFINLVSITSTDRINIRKFLKSIKTNFLISKGTEYSYRYLLKQLFSVTNVHIDYPKKYLMRLNGGKFIDIGWNLDNNTIIDLPDNFDPTNPIQNDVLAGDVGYNTLTRPNLFGSALNEAVLSDNYFWQDYSYILTSDASTEEAKNYKSTILSGSHPAGMLGFFEQYTFIGDTDTGTDVTGDNTLPVSSSELPVIKRYLLMDFLTEDSGTLYDTWNEGICNDTIGYACYCCDNYCDPEGGTEFFPEHAWPDWDQEVASKLYIGGGMQNVVIGDFLELAGSASPNINRATCVTFNCAAC